VWFSILLTISQFGAKIESVYRDKPDYQGFSKATEELNGVLLEMMGNARLCRRLAEHNLAVDFVYHMDFAIQGAPDSDLGRIDVSVGGRGYRVSIEPPVWENRKVHEIAWGDTPELLRLIDQSIPQIL